MGVKYKWFEGHRPYIKTFFIKESKIFLEIIRTSNVFEIILEEAICKNY